MATTAPPIRTLTEIAAVVRVAFLKSLGQEKRAVFRAVETSILAELPPLVVGAPVATPIDTLDQYLAVMPSTEEAWRRVFLTLRAHARWRATSADYKSGEWLLVKSYAECVHQYVQPHVVYNYASHASCFSDATAARALWAQVGREDAVSTRVGSACMTPAFRALRVSMATVGGELVTAVNPETGERKTLLARTPGATPTDGVEAGPCIRPVLVTVHRGGEASTVVDPPPFTATSPPFTATSPPFSSPGVPAPRL